MTGTPHWLQLTYTSSDDPRTAQGGWGVKETSPGLPPHRADVLRGGVVTRIEEIEPTDTFASEAALAARPRRLLAISTDSGAVCLWHAASAGPDATGRPGNVFTHAALLEDPPADLRPIDYWRSPDWLAPFGAAEVNAARIGELRPGTVVSRETVIDFVAQGDTRFDAEWLLAALVHVWGSGGGRTLVLPTETPDLAASWIAVFSHLTSAAHARRLRWVTFDRAANLPKLVGQDRLDVVCVPTADLPELLTAVGEMADPTILVVDPAADESEVTRVDGQWTYRGQSWPAEPRWQNAVLDLFALDRPRIVEVLQVMDELTAGLTADAAGVAPHWPLSLAMLVAEEESIADSAGLKRELEGDAMPAVLRDHPLVVARIGPRAPAPASVSTARTPASAVALAPEPEPAPASEAPAVAVPHAPRNLAKSLFVNDEVEQLLEQSSREVADAGAKLLEAQVRYWILADVADQQDDLPAHIKQSLAEAPKRWMSGVVDLLGEASDEVAIELVFAAINRKVKPRHGQSVLSADMAPNQPVGWTGVLTGWMGKSPQSKAPIQQALKTRYGGTLSEYYKLAAQLMEDHR